MLHLYNTLTRKKDHFHPLYNNQVGLYTCGPTVYNYVHLGNLRTYVFEDILKRTLKYLCYKVTHVMNITDVGHLTDDADNGEDKMEKGARREGKTALEIAKFYTDKFKQDLAQLNILEPNIWCKATDNIAEQIVLVKTLIAKGYTYETTDGIYFDTTKLDDYGKLAQLDNNQLEAGSRVAMREKLHPHDFALWKFTAPGEKRQMEWPFGVDASRKPKMGFPGWHIECSAMAMKYLGEQFDIHCGGVDHIPIHHTNEIAQTEAATGKIPWVQFWLHGEFLLSPDTSIEAEHDYKAQIKMAKSEENFLTLASLNEHNISPLAYRYLLLQAHYRKQLTFSWEALEAAQNGLDRLRKLVQTIDKQTTEDPRLQQEFIEAIGDDLNTPAALSVLWNALRERRMTQPMVISFDKILGLNLHEHNHETKAIPAEVERLLEARAAARHDGSFKESDRLRAEILEKGFVVEDTPEGQHLRPE